MRELYLRERYSLRELAAMFKVSRMTVWRAVWTGFEFPVSSFGFRNAERGTGNVFWVRA